MGEGWRWERIQHDPCPQCGQYPAALQVAVLGDLALSGAASWRTFLAAADDAAVRTAPAPDVWTPLQYGMHVADMLRVFGDRIVRAAAEDDPSVPWYDPGHEAWPRYNAMDRPEVARAIDSAADRLDGILATLRSDEWSRTARRGVDRFTVAGMACFAVHESHHHLLDATGTLVVR